VRALLFSVMKFLCVGYTSCFSRIIIISTILSFNQTGSDLRSQRSQNNVRILRVAREGIVYLSRTSVQKSQAMDLLLYFARNPVHFGVMKVSFYGLAKILEFGGWDNFTRVK